MCKWNGKTFLILDGSNQSPVEGDLGYQFGHHVSGLILPGSLQVCVGAAPKLDGGTVPLSDDMDHFLRAAMAVRHQRLIKLEIIYLLFPGNGKKVVLILAGFLSCLFYAILIVFGYTILDTVVVQHSPALHISMAIPYAAIPVGGLLMIGNTIASLLDPGADRGVDPL